MRLIQIIPNDGVRLYGLLVAKEIEHAKKNRGTLYRSGPKQRDTAKWAHSNYKGWIKLRRSEGEVVTVEIRSRSHASDEWQLFQAFIGFLDRHFKDDILAINIQYR